MQVEGVKLSDFDSEDAFIQDLIDRSWNPGQVEYYKDDGDYDGKAVVCVSWGSRYSNINMETDGDDWIERYVSYDDIMEAENKCE